MSERFTRWSDFPMEVRPILHPSIHIDYRSGRHTTLFPRFSELASTSWSDMIEAESNSAVSASASAASVSVSASAASVSNSAAATSESNSAAAASESELTSAQPRLLARIHERIRRDVEDKTERELKSQILALQSELQNYRERVRMRRREFEDNFAKLDSASTTCKGTVTDPALITNECPITCEPLTITTAYRLTCGHSCDRASLHTWWKSSSTGRTCPLCRNKEPPCPCSKCTPAKPSCTCGRCHLRPSFDDILLRLNINDMEY